MTFLAPWWLAGLPLLVLLLVARGVRTRTATVGDHVLWARAAGEARRTEGRRRRLERWWWAVPAASLCVALAQPAFVTRDPGVIVLDRSVGGDLRIDGSTRIARALAAARVLLPGADVVGWPPPDADASEVGASGRDVSAADVVAAASNSAVGGRPVVLATWRDISVPSGIGAAIVADRAEHAALAAAWVDGDGRRWVRVAGTQAVGARTLVMRDASGVETRRIDIPNATAAVVAFTEPDDDRVRSVSLEPFDAHPDDDVLRLGDGAGAVRKVAVRRGTPEDLVRALRAMIGVDVVTADDVDADLAVGFVGRRASLFHPTGDWPAEWRFEGESRALRGIAGAGALRGIGDAAATVDGWRSLRGAEGAEIVMQVEGRPLAGVSGNRAFLAAEPAQGDWATRAVFPRIVAALVDRVAPPRAEPWTRCGRTSAVRAPTGAVATLVRPDGRRVDVTAVDGAFRIGSDRPGVAVLTDADGGRRELAFSALSDAAVTEVATRDASVPVPLGAGETRRDLSTLFLLLAALVAAGLAFPRR